MTTEDEFYKKMHSCGFTEDMLFYFVKFKHKVLYGINQSGIDFVCSLIDAPENVAILVCETGRVQSDSTLARAARRSGLADRETIRVLLSFLR